MNTHETRALFRRCACICSFFLVGTASIAAEAPASTGAKSATATAAVPVVTVIKPVAFVLCTAEGDGAIEKCGALGGAQDYAVAGNRTLLIEQITGTCFGAPEAELPARPQRIAIRVVTGGTQVEHILFAIRLNGGFEGFSDDTRLYADPGSTISVDIGGIKAADGGHLCRLAFSGQFVR